MCAVAGAIFGALGAGLALPAERESRPAHPLVDFARPPGQRPDRQAARRSRPHARRRGGASPRFGVALGLRFEERLARGDPVRSCAGADLGAGSATVVIAIARARGRAGHGDLAGRGVHRAWCSSTPVSPPSRCFRPGCSRRFGFSRCRRRSRRCGACRGRARAVAAAAGRPCGPFGLVAVFAPMAVRGYRAAAEAGCPVTRLALLDQAAFLRLRATGQGSVCQCTWMYDRDMDIDELHIQRKSRDGTARAPDRAFAVAVRTSSLGRGGGPTRHRPRHGRAALATTSAHGSTARAVSGRSGVRTDLPPRRPAARRRRHGRQPGCVALRRGRPRAGVAIAEAVKGEAANSAIQHRVTHAAFGRCSEDAGDAVRGLPEIVRALIATLLSCCGLAI